MDSDSSASLVFRGGSRARSNEGSSSRGRRRTRRESNGAMLTHDLIIEILLRLPVRSLMRFKCVCKQWYGLILSRDFFIKHNSRKNKRLWLLTATCESSGPDYLPNTVTFLFDHLPTEIDVPPCTNWIKIVACFNGVVCLSLLSGKKSRNYFVLWNPATGASREICPSSIIQDFRELASSWILWKANRGSSGFGVSFNATGISFKIAHINIFHASSSAHVEIFSSSINSWRVNKVNLPCHIGKGLRSGGAYCANWYMYWLIHDFMECKYIYILCFDMVRELFTRIELPLLRPIEDYVNLAGHDESLAMFVHKKIGIDCNIDVHVMNDCSGTDQSWHRVLSFRTGYTNGLLYAVGFFTKDDVDSVVLSTRNGSLYLYDPRIGETKKWRREKCDGRKITLYSESLASLE